MIAPGEVYYRRGGWYRQGRLGAYRLMGPDDTSRVWNSQEHGDERCALCVSRVPHSWNVHGYLYGVSVRHYLNEAPGGPGRW